LNESSLRGFQARHYAIKSIYLMDIIYIKGIASPVPFFGFQNHPLNDAGQQLTKIAP
jgi:hypothetical protein